MRRATTRLLVVAVVAVARLGVKEVLRTRGGPGVGPPFPTVRRKAAVPVRDTRARLVDVAILTAMRRVVAASALGVLLSGCSGAAHVSTTPTPAATTPAPNRPGGLVGAIDAARVASVCANAQSAQTLMAGGSDRAAADALVAAALLLERPPVDPTAAAAAVTIRTDLRRSHIDAAVTAALTFCHAHQG